MEEYDYGDYVTLPTESIDLTELQRLAEAQARAEAKVKNIEAQLNAAKDELREIAERRLPELMDSIGLDTFTTQSGLKIKVKEIIRASIPKANEHRAFAWLRATGNGALIKRQLTVSFGMGEDDEADNLSTELSSEYEDVQDKTSVHQSTLKSFITKKLQEGENIPIELFGVHRQRCTEVDI